MEESEAALSLGINEAAQLVLCHNAEGGRDLPGTLSQDRGPVLCVWPLPSWDMVLSFDCPASASMRGLYISS